MALPLTQHSLNKLEDLMEAIGYKVRYERGNFRTGICILENHKIVVINRFANLESKIVALTELIVHFDLDELSLNNKQLQLTQFLKEVHLRPQKIA